MNLFPYERIESDKEFFGRETEIRNINEFINHSNNLVIFSKRRLGKSSLINEVLYKLKKSNPEILSIYVDVYDITSAEDFATIDVLNEQNISKNVMQSSINSLIDREILDKNDDILFIPDRAFELWRQKFYI